ncbi:MAG: oxidoreductase [Maribacter sp.]|nr:MAG: oxidoreductase [Maribacter sp.]
MKDDKKVRWGIIGCGAVTEVKSVPAYQNMEGFEVYAVMRRNKEKASDYAKRHGIPVFYTDADELIADKNIDAVYIATPPDSHKEYALKVAEAGKPCCVEKPMAPNYPDSLEIYKAFNDKNLPLFIAYYRRSLPRFGKIKEWLDNGGIGEVRQVHWQLSKQPNKKDLSGEYNWRTDATIALGGYFDDLASHGLDLFVHLLGDITEASGISTNQLGLYTAKDALVGHWKHESGVLGSGSWNFGCYKREDKVGIYGSKGKIVFSVFDEAPIILINPRGEEKLEIGHPKHIQQFHVANIKDHLMGVKEHPSLGKSGLHVSWVMDRILGNI